MKRIAVTCLVALLTLTGATPVAAQGGNDLFQQALRKERVDGDLKAAIVLYQRILKEQAADRSLCAKTLVQLGQAYEKMGNADARSSYQRVLRDYADQAEQVTVARARLNALSAGAAGTTNGSTLTVRKVMSSDITGQVSADGRFLSFTDWKAGNVAIRDLASGQNRLLTEHGNVAGGGGFAEPSVPSPDGRSVAYAWYNANGFDLCVVGVDGSKPRILRAVGNGILRHIPLAWSPDSRHLLAEFVKSDGTRDMTLVTVSDGSTKLLKAVGKDVSPGGVFSPDGRYIAWATKEGFSLVEIQTGIESPLIPDRSVHSVLGWAPDGKHLLFSSARSGSNDAWLVAVAGGKAEGEPMLVKKDWGLLPMGVTRSGAFYYGVSNNVWEVQIAELNAVDGNAESPQQRAFQRGNTRSPAWSPDGRSLASVDARDPSQAVIIRSLDTGEEREIRVGERTIGMGGIRWTPDGKAVVVQASESGKGENLIRIDVQSGRVTALMSLPTLGGWPNFKISRDGNTVLYARPSASPTDADGVRIVAHDLRSGEERTVVERRGLYRGGLSPDGRQVLIGEREGQSQVVLVMPVDGGDARELFRVDREKEVLFAGGPSWTPDGRHLVYLKRAKEKAGQWQAWRVAAEGGEPHRVGLISARQLVGFALHPDGRRVAISDVKVDLELWVMENFLPRTAAAKQNTQR